MQQIVDPFMPVTMQLPRHKPLQVRRVIPRAQTAGLPRRPATLDGMISRPARRTFVSNSEFRRPTVQAARPTAAQPTISEVKPVQAPAVNQSVFENQFVPGAKPVDAAPAAAKTVKKSRTKRILSALQVPAIILISVVVGYFMQSLVYGEIAIAVYAVIALLFKVASRTTFMLALMSLFVIIVLVLTQPNSALATNFAVYTFLLLVVGTLSLGREVRKEA